MNNKRFSVLAIVLAMLCCLSPARGQQLVQSVPIQFIQPFNPNFPILQLYCSTNQLYLGTHLIEYQPPSSLAWNDPNRVTTPNGYVDCAGNTGAQIITAGHVTSSYTLLVQAPPTDRNIIGSEALAYQGIITIGGGGGSVVGVRGVVELNPGATLNAGYLFGTEGKVQIFGTLTTQSGGGVVAGIYGQFDLTGATLTNAGLTAPGAFDMGSAGPSVHIANLHGVLITNSTPTQAGSAIHIATTSSGFANVMSIADTSGTMAVTTGSPGTCTSSGYMNVLVNSTVEKVPFCQ